jgi:hypothetical protein
MTETVIRFACAWDAGVWVHIATGRPVVVGGAVGIAAIVGLHVGAVPSVVAPDVGLGQGSGD